MRCALQLAALVALVALPAWAAEDTQPSQQQELENLRREVAGQLQLKAYDLLDELVYSWSQQPPLPTETPMVLADVSVPVGFGTGLEALLENHLVGLLLKNRKSNVVLVHCPQCSAMVVRSNAKGTIIARGFDEPQTLAAAGAQSSAQHALFLDFEAEGAALVLRARITELNPKLPIVYAKTLTTTTSSAALLRDGENLKSAEAARKEYLDALQGRIWGVPVRVAVRAYKPGAGQQVAPAPMLWLQGGFELAFSQARAWLASVSLGVSWAPQLHVGFQAQGRLGRLLTGNTTSLTYPDVYAFVGASVMLIQGRAAVTFSDDVPTIDQLTSPIRNAEPQAVLGAVQTGFEVRVKNRVGFAVYIESLPGITTDTNLGRFLDLSFIKFQTLGFEVMFCF